MADRTPGGALQSFAGNAITGLPNVASIGYPDIKEEPSEAYVLTAGQIRPVDLLNSADAPSKQTVTIQVLVRAPDSTTDPGQAWQAVMTGVRALKGLPSTGLLIVNLDASGGSGTASCQARLRPIDVSMKPSNARHYAATLVFTPTTPWQ